MKPKSLDKKISETIKLIRRSKNLTQFYIANCTSLTDGTYGKYENASIDFTIGYLEEVANCLDIDIIQIIMIAQGLNGKTANLKPLSIILLNFIKVLQLKEEGVKFTANELDELIEKIKENYNKE